MSAVKWVFNAPIRYGNPLVSNNLLPPMGPVTAHSWTGLGRNGLEGLPVHLPGVGLDTQSIQSA